MDEKFGKQEKLKSKLIIDRLFSEGQSLKKYPLRLIYLPILDTKHRTNKTAVSVSKRNFRKAVDRIYLKRLMREAFRKNKYLVSSNLYSPFAFMFIYTAREKVSYAQVHKAMEDILKRFGERYKNEEL